MTADDWKYIIHFTVGEKWGDPEKMDPELIGCLDDLRAFCGNPIEIHCGWEERDTGYHPSGKAVDLHIEGISLFDAFMISQRFPVFTGIGVYPWWHNPGLHLDTRPKLKNQPRSVWGSTGPKKYVGITQQFLYQTF